MHISLLNVDSSSASTTLTNTADASSNAEGSWTWTPTDMSLVGGGYVLNVRCADGSFQDNSTEFVIDVTAAPSPARAATSASLVAAASDSACREGS